MVSFLTALYAIMGTLGIMAYIPQFLALWHDKGRSESVPMMTWILWGGNTAVGFVYAWLVNGDPTFIILCFMGMIGANACLGMLVFNRYLKNVDKPLEKVAEAMANVTEKMNETVQGTVTSVVATLQPVDVRERQ